MARSLILEKLVYQAREILLECGRRGLDRIRQAADAVGQTGGTGRQRLQALMRDINEEIAKV